MSDAKRAFLYGSQTHELGTVFQNQRFLRASIYMACIPGQQIDVGMSIPFLDTLSGNPYPIHFVVASFDAGKGAGAEALAVAKQLESGDADLKIVDWRAVKVIGAPAFVIASVQTHVGPERFVLYDCTPGLPPEQYETYATKDEACEAAEKLLEESGKPE